ncbi:hypothetical protein ACHAWF_001047, partial [Thalassiosira exigua]
HVAPRRAPVRRASQPQLLLVLACHCHLATFHCFPLHPSPFLIIMIQTIFLITVLLSAFAISLAKDVAVVVQSPSDGPPVTRSNRYQSHVTLYIQNSDGSKTPSGWSTRQSDGAAKDSPFEFQPGVGLIEGWTEGVLKMKEGERSWISIPSEKGYGAQEMGSPSGAGFYIPANSDLLFDIEILEKDAAAMKDL